MVIKLQSKDLYNFAPSLNRDDQLWAYNGLDSAVTLRVHQALSEVIEKRNEPGAAISYRFVRAMQGPAMAMMLRGVCIQQRVRQDELQRAQAERAQAQALLDRLADAVWGPEEYVEVIRTKVLETPVGKRGQPLTPRLVTHRKEVAASRPRGLNPASAPQMLAFFNGALGFPVEYEIRKKPEGNIRTATADDATLRKWAKRRTKGPGINPRDRNEQSVTLAQPFVSLILRLRDLDKQLTVLRSQLEPDGRMRCSYNVAGTKWGRWSSSKNQYGRGTNLQNITDTMRRMFCADDGWRCISTDLEQAESRLVAGCVWQATGDRTYLDACLSGDLHTRVCMMAWRDLPWRGDNPNDPHNRHIAESVYPNLGGLTYRDVAKRIGHGSNYNGSPYGIAQAVGIPPWIVEEFQVLYFSAFPAIRQWHNWVKEQLVGNRSLTTPLGRQLIFFDRPDKPETLREAIATVPQSTVAELLNLILYRCWERSLLRPNDPNHLPIQILLQNHDAFLLQTLEIRDLPTIIQAINKEFERATVPFTRGNQSLALNIPGEFVTGWNWAKVDPEKRNFADGNPDGLAKWRGNDNRVRQQAAKVAPSEWLSGPLPNVY